MKVLEPTTFGVAFAVGAILALGVLNFVVGIRLRDRVYLWYAATIAAFSLFVLVPLDFTLVVYFALAAMFARAFLEVPVRSPRLWTAIIVAFVLNVLIAALRLRAFEPAADAVYLLLLFAAGIAAVRRGDNGAKAYGFAFAGVVAGVLIGVCGRDAVIPRSLLTDLAPSVGVVWEALILAVALADRIRGLYATATALRTERDALEEVAFKDALTGIANRGAFEQRLDEEWKRATRTRSPIALVMFDVDSFKAYNDHNGHLAGDRVLTRIGTILRASVRRPDDVVARFGGEEFVMLLPGATREDAAKIADGVRRAVRTAGISHRQSEYGFVTISAGVAGGVPRADGEPERLVGAADRALYAAKHDGRNRVVVAQRATKPAAPPAR
jgi:diguanylate cyclase (GGDEF)-like protein